MNRLSLLFLPLLLIACESPLEPSNVDTDDDQSQIQTVVITFVTPPPGSPDGDGGRNQAPIVEHPGDQTNDARDVVTLQIRAVDPNGDPLSYRLISPPRGLGIDQNGLIRGEISPSSSDDSPFETTVSVNDGKQPTTVTFTWVVHAVPEE